MKKLTSLSLSIFCFSIGLFSQTENKINSINSGMPNRISMNVTVPKQTQGATFGEKVNSGLHAAGAFVVFPNKQAFVINSAQSRISEMPAAEVSRVNAGLHAAGGAVAQGAALVGGALPGGAIISAAVSRYDNNSVVWQTTNTKNELKMPASLPDGEYELALVLDAGSKDAAKFQAFFGLRVEGGTYKVVAANTKHDTAKNSVGNIR
jgi:hypothetical protein